MKRCIYTFLLDREVKHVEDSLKPIKDSWVKTRVSIISDGWKDARNHPLINIIVVSHKGNAFESRGFCGVGEE